MQTQRFKEVGETDWVDPKREKYRFLPLFADRFTTKNQRNKW